MVSTAGHGVVTAASSRVDFIVDFIVVQLRLLIFLQSSVHFGGSFAVSSSSLSSKVGRAHRGAGGRSGTGKDNRVHKVCHKAPPPDPPKLPLPLPLPLLPHCRYSAGEDRNNAAKNRSDGGKRSDGFPSHASRSPGRHILVGGGREEDADDDADRIGVGRGLVVVVVCFLWVAA